MPSPNVRHFHVKIQHSFVHLAQYGHPTSIIKTNPKPKELETGSNGSKPEETSVKSGQQVSKLVIFVPGNPGILGMYHDFLIALYQTVSSPSNADNNPVILAISHNNFDHPDHCNFKADERICIEENELNFVQRATFQHFQDPNEVELQVLNKLIILKRLLNVDLNHKANPGPKLVFVGHSIGCYVILRLLQDKTLAKLHAGSILVHPALENLATTRKGAVIERYFVLKLDFLIRAAAYLLEKLLPKPARLVATKWFLTPEFASSSSLIVLESMAQMVCWNSLLALVQMAKSELVNVRDLDHKTMIEPHLDKLRLIFCTSDHWVNDAYPLNLMEMYPTLHVEIQDTLHAFIMDPNVVKDYTIKIGMFIQDMFEA